MGLSYIAVDVKVLHNNSETKIYTLSINNVENEYTNDIQRLLQEYIKGDLHLIEDIKKVQTFLLCAGYGLSNCIILDASKNYVVAT